MTVLIAKLCIYISWDLFECWFVNENDEFYVIWWNCDLYCIWNALDSRFMEDMSFKRMHSKRVESYLTSANDICFGSKHIDNFSFSFITPLCACKKIYSENYFHQLNALSITIFEQLFEWKSLFETKQKNRSWFYTINNDNNEILNIFFLLPRTTVTLELYSLLRFEFKQFPFSWVFFDDMTPISKVCDCDGIDFDSIYIFEFLQRKVLIISTFPVVCDELKLCGIFSNCTKRSNNKSRGKIQFKCITKRTKIIYRKINWNVRK